MPKLSIVIPVHNEEDNVSILHKRIKQVVNTEKELIFIDDGSTDQTLTRLKELAEADDECRYISFSRNFGHQAALKAGLDSAKGDYVVSMDGDLQHPPELIPELLSKLQDGFNIVNTQRKDQESLSAFKSSTSKLFYNFLNLIGGLDLQPGSADFRALDRAALEALQSHQELDVFYRGLVPKLGFHQATVRYQPADRIFGTPSYNFQKMLRLALTGIVSTTTRPLRFTTILAAIMGAVSIGYAAYAIIVYALYKVAIPGWTSTVLAVTIIGSMQLFVLGILGEYLAQTLIEVRRRPPYIVSESNIRDDEGR